VKQGSAPAAAAADPARAQTPPRSWRLLGLATLLAAATYLSARLAYGLALPSLVAIWIPAGLSLAVLARLRTGAWPAAVAGIWLGNVGADFLQGNPPVVLVIAPIANVLESLLAAWVVRRVCRRVPSLTSLREVLALVLGAAAGANGITAILGGLALRLGYGTGLWNAWVTWWVGDALGMLIVAPVVWTLADLRRRHLAALRVPARAIEAAAIVAVGAAVSLLVFRSGPALTAYLHPGLYLVFPVLVWAALRFGPPGAALANLVLAGIVVWSTGQGIGFFAEPDRSSLHQAVEVYTFLTVASLSSLVPAAIAAERGRASERLRENEAALRVVADTALAAEHRYRLLFEGSPEAMWVYDTATLAFLAVNDTAVRRYGYQREQFLAMTLRDIRPPDEAERLDRAVAAGPDALEALTAVRHRTSGGAILDVEVSAHDLAFEGRAARLVIARDVTERRQLETQLREAQKLEAIGQLASAIAHDFGNLLQGIVGYTGLALDGLPPDAPARADVAEARATAERAAGLTRQLLAYSRRQRLSPRVLMPAELVESISGLLRQLAGRQVDLVTVLPPDLGRIEADPSQLEQVLVNLVVNARDAMPGGGRVTLEGENVVLDAAAARRQPGAHPGPYVCLAVRDSGIGMDAATRARIFEPFFTTKGGSGTGLGLATVYGIVSQSGGHIRVDSEPGHGSTFAVYLPRVAGPPAASPTG
jgi:PAS domain S-box-containing protein